MKNKMECKKGKMLCKRIASVILAIAVTVSSVVIPKTTTYAYTYGPGVFVTTYMNQVYPDIKQIAAAYVVGDDGIPKSTSKVYIQPVAEGTKIQGQEIDPKYMPQDNMQELRDMYESTVISGVHLSWPNCAYIERECCVLKVVYYDEEKVIFWSNGYRSFTALSPTQCRQDNYKESNRPGFYQIARKEVWLDTGRSAEYNIIPKSEKNKAAAATGQVTGKVLAVRTIPGIGNPGTAYGLMQNETVDVVSTERIAAIDGSKDTYYKIRLNGNTGTSYMKYKTGEGYYYVNSLYLNIKEKGVSEPDGLVDGYVTNLSSGKGRRVYNEKKTAVSATEGVVANSTPIRIFPDETDTKFVTIWFNGKKCYLEKAYVKQGTEKPVYRKVTNLRIKDVVDGEYVLTWDAAAGCTDYSIAFMQAKALDHYSAGDAFARDLHFKDTTYTVSSKNFKKYSAIYAIVTANYGSQTTQVCYVTLKMPEKTEKLTKSQIFQDNNRLYFSDCSMVQYSTNKNFKNAKTIKNNSLLKVAKNLKKNKTYYVRYCNYETVQTENGKKTIQSKWSNVQKVKYTGKSSD